MGTLRRRVPAARKAPTPNSCATRCKARLRAAGNEALNYARTLWFSGRDLPESCTPLFDALAANGQLTAEMCGRGSGSRSKPAIPAWRGAHAEYLPQKEPPETRRWPGIAVNPQAYLERKNFNLKTRAGRETVMFAVQRLARTAPPLAAPAVGEARRALSARASAVTCGA